MSSHARRSRPTSVLLVCFAMQALATQLRSQTNLSSNTRLNTGISPSSRRVMLYSNWNPVDVVELSVVKENLTSLPFFSIKGGSRSAPPPHCVSLSLSSLTTNLSKSHVSESTEQNDNIYMRNLLSFFQEKYSLQSFLHTDNKAGIVLTLQSKLLERDNSLVVIRYVQS